MKMEEDDGERISKHVQNLDGCNRLAQSMVKAAVFMTKHDDLAIRPYEKNKGIP